MQLDGVLFIQVKYFVLFFRCYSLKIFTDYKKDGPTPSKLNNVKLTAYSSQSCSRVGNLGMGQICAGFAYKFNLNKKFMQTSLKIQKLQRKH